MDDKPKGQKTWTEEIEIAANDLVGRVKSLIQEGNVRRIIIREPDGDLVLEVPLTTGAVAGGIMVAFAPLLAALGALAALVARVKVEIVRTDVGGGPGQGEA
ncbi:MAG: DUF4342 domain-containing protein [Chloroflexi bacterium]|nr:DUF4342 domain-containing protein [Chloroflexota bacterium]